MQYLRDRLDYDVRSEFGNFRVLMDVWFRFLGGEHTRLIDFYEQTYEDRDKARHEPLIVVIAVTLVTTILGDIAAEEYRARRKEILRTLGRLRRQCELGLGYLFDMDAIRYLELNHKIGHAEYLKLARQLKIRLRRSRPTARARQRLKPYYRQFGLSSSMELTRKLETMATHAEQPKNITATTPILKKARLIHGLPASPGMAEGRIRVIRNIDDGKRIRIGDVGVFHYMVPDLVPAMRSCSAVIGTGATGGMTGHLAVSARALELPAVVGVDDKDGILLEGTVTVVNGRSGTVHVLG